MRPADSDPLQFGAESTLEQDAHAAEEEPTASAPPAPDAWRPYPLRPGGGPLSTSPPPPGHEALYPSIPQQLDTASTTISLASPALSQGLPSPSASACSHAHHYPPLQQPGTPASIAAGAGAAGAAAAALSADIQILVRHPQQHAGVSTVPGIPGASYLTYEVVTTTTLPHFSNQQLSVRRRFKDFVSLSRLLPQHLHGSFLPARPHRNALGSARNAPSFVADRRVALERYMNRLAAHPAVARSEVLRVFLEADGNLRRHPAWLSLKPKVLTPAQATTRLFAGLVSGGAAATPTPSEVVQPAAVRRDMYRLIKERTTAFRRRSSSGLTTSATDEETALCEAEALLEDLGAAQDHARALAARWVAALRGASSGMSALGGALQSLAEYEASCRRVDTQGLNAAAQGCARGSSRLAAAASGACAALQPLEDYSEMQGNVMAALAARRAALCTLQTLQADLEAARGRLATLSLSPATQARKVDALRNQVTALEAAASAAQGEYARQLQRNSAELSAFRAQRGRELAAMMEAVAAEQAAHCRAAADSWQGVAAQLQALEPLAPRSLYRQGAAGAAPARG